MIHALRRIAAALALASAVAAPHAAAAAQRLHGTVLTLLPAKHEAVVRHDAYGDMPGMTMVFRLSPGTDVKSVHEGDLIQADVDDAADPAVLSNVVVLVPAGISRPLPSHVHLLDVGDAIPPAQMIAQTGKPFSLADLRGKTVVLAFIYTRCRDSRMCPLIAAKFHTLQEKLKGGPFHLVLVTLDPEFDRPGVLYAYGAALEADPAMWTLATGDPQTILDFDARFGIIPFPDEKVGLIHTERTVVIGPTGIIRNAIDDPSWSPDEIVAAARAAADMPSNPVERFDLWLSQKAVALCGNSVAGFSGLLDLIVVLAIFTVATAVLVRIARHLFSESA